MDYMKIILWGNIFGSVGQETSGVAQFLKRSNSASYSWGCFIFTLWSDDTQNQTLCSLITIFQTPMTRKPWCLLDFFSNSSGVSLSFFEAIKEECPSTILEQLHALLGILTRSRFAIPAQSDHDRATPGRWQVKWARTWWTGEGWDRSKGNFYLKSFKNMHEMPM